MFSGQVLAHPSAKDKFSDTPDIMNRAVSCSVGAGTQRGAGGGDTAHLARAERKKDFWCEAIGSGGRLRTWPRGAAVWPPAPCP